MSVDSGAVARARAAVRAGDWRSAAMLLAPDVQAGTSAAAVALGAEVALAFGAYAEACDLARRAVAIDDRPDIEGALQLVRLLRRLELPWLLDRAFGRFGVERWPTAVLAELAVLASSAALFAHARALGDRLLAEAPASADAHYVAGLLAMFEGDRVASVAALGRAVAIEPRMGNAHWLLAMQADADDAAARVQVQQAALAGILPGSEAEAYMRFSLHRWQHALGRYDEAWASLSRGMDVARRLQPFDPRAANALFDALDHLALPEPRGTAGSEFIFIVGMFRSGTSLIERVITGHPDVVDGGETYQFTAALREAADYECPGVLDAELLRRAAHVDGERVAARMDEYSRWRRAGRRRLTEKLPSNFLNLPLLMRFLPGATFVHLRRDPRDTCFSNLRTYFRGAAAYSNDPLQMADYYLRYDAQMRRWQAAAPDRIIEVDYGAFVAAPESESRRLLRACGLDYDPRVLDLAATNGHSATASAGQVRQGILTDRGGAWRPYERQLAGMLDRLHAGSAS